MKNNKRAKLLIKTLREDRELLLIKSEENERLMSELSCLRSKLISTEADLAKKTSLWRQDRDVRDKHELSARLATMNALPTLLKEISGTKPILWVSTEDTRILDHQGLSNINYMIRNVAPKIDLVIVTRGQVELKELDDEELKMIGLKRNKDT